MAWVYLGGAIVSEVAATLALKASNGFTKLWPDVIVAVGYLLSFVLLAQALRSLNVGPAYAVWSGFGTIGAAVGGWLIFSESLSALTVAGMAVTIGGVVVMNLGGVKH